MMSSVGGSRWRWLLPSVSHWMFLLVFVTLLSQPWRTAMVASDGDACMHWRVGEWMLQHRQVIRHDEFSHTKAGQPVISKEWLSEILFALPGSLLGIAVVGALVIAGAFAFLHWQLIRDGSDLLIATAITVLGLWAASSHWLARPHAFSFLMMVWWNEALRRERFALLPVLTILWVNLHGAFLAGFVVLAAYWLGALLERKWGRLKKLSFIALLCGGASLINPNGIQLHVHNLAFLRSDFLTGWLAEYSSANFHSSGSWGLLAWLALIFFTLAVRRPQLPASAALLLISWTYFALYAGRNIPLLVIVTAPILAPAWSGLWRDRLRQINASSAGWPVMTAAVIAWVVFIPHPTEMPAERWPVQAVEFIRQHPQSGNMFNQYTWGGYLMKALPEYKTFVDGRTDFFGEDLIREFADTTALRPNWVAPLQKYQVQWTIMPSDHRLNLALAAWGTWTNLYSDGVATIWRRK